MYINQRNLVQRNRVNYQKVATVILQLLLLQQTIITFDKNVSMADEAMITAIAESAFAESKSSPPLFLYPVIPNSPSSSFPSLPLSERSSNQSSSPIIGPPIITQSIVNPSLKPSNK
ncbi:hypothetical protein F8M41_008725 [Gigaspora margarita]|uniref:Uncharacterized protein n=1 Tax=Gigaspora margarita TaxID=4874 RepID=A0A8H4AVP4_GIGMA|nr:hypothetical protein F8M41_008725 [Gigaspora margarita]